MKKVTYMKGTQIVSEAEATENGVVRDGFRVVSHVSLMDSRSPAAMLAATTSGAMHRPGFVDNAPANEATLEAARDAKLKALGDAWRNPPALDEAQITKPTVPAATDGGDVYARRDARLRDAWRAA